MKISKILIINPFGIGDVIFSTPLIEILKEAYPDNYICYICNKRAYDVIASNPRLDKVFIYEKDDYRTIWQKSKVRCVRKIIDFLKLIRNEKFDLAIDLSLAYQYSLLLRCAGIKSSVGFNYRNRGRFLTRRVDIDGFNDKHVVEYYLDILRLLKIQPRKHKVALKIYLSGKDIVWADDFLRISGVDKKDMLIGVIPGCGTSWGDDAQYRRWSREGFAQVCDGIIERYEAKVILLGDAKEIEICQDVQRMMKHRAIMACGKTILSNFLGLVHRCGLVITNDGGPLHMAVGLGVKTISIFGPVDERVYGPYPPGPDNMVISKDISCRPCYKKFKHNICKERSCLKGISADEVLDAADIMLGRKAEVPQ